MKGSLTIGLILLLMGVPVCAEGNLSFADLFNNLEAVRAAAEQGEAEAQFLLGFGYTFGKGVPKDSQLAFMWYRKAAEQGHAKAELKLGEFYDPFVPPDHPQQADENTGEHYLEALKWYRRAAEKGDPRAQYRLGSLQEMHENPEAIEWYRRAAEQGEASAQRALGSLYRSGGLVSQDYEKALAWYERAIKQGDQEAEEDVCGLHFETKNYQAAIEWCGRVALRLPGRELGVVKAQVTLGEIYYNGMGVPPDYQEAAKWFRKAASSLHGEKAQLYLARIYNFGGPGVRQDWKEAAKWYLRIAESWDGESSLRRTVDAITSKLLISRWELADAQFWLGFMYKEGILGAPDEERAFSWFRKAAAWLQDAAEGGDEWAQCRLGKMYDAGYGFTKNSREAAKWFRRAAEQGDLLAQHELATLYLNGRGVPQDHREAERLYIQAAQSGLSVSQFELGRIYSEGKGVAQDFVQAHLWFNIAAAVGYETAAERRDALAEKMTTQEISEAQRLAREWWEQREE